MDRKLKVIFMGGKQAGCICLLAILADKCNVLGVVAYDATIRNLAKSFNIPTFSSIQQIEIEKLLGISDLLISAHGREIVPDRLLRLPSFGGINIHPCLYAYKGANPIERFLCDGNTKASVGIHRMTNDIDRGEVLVEDFIDVSGKNSVDEVYNTLYPIYAMTLLKAMRKLSTLDYPEALRPATPFPVEEDIFPWDEDVSDLGNLACGRSGFKNMKTMR